MKTLRLLLATAVVSLLVACSAPTDPYPQPPDEGEEPDPGPALVVGIGR